jgi:hypothetical protein
MQLGQPESIRLISGFWDATAKSLAFIGSIMGLDLVVCGQYASSAHPRANPGDRPSHGEARQAGGEA